MRKLMCLLPAVALWMVPPAVAQGPLDRPYGPLFGPPRLNFPGVGDPFGRPSGMAGLPGVGDPLGRPGNLPGMPPQLDPFGWPRRPWQQDFDPVNPLGRPGLPGWPGGHAPFSPRSPRPGRDPVNPLQDDKDRDKHGVLGAQHIPHLLAPEFRPAPEYKMSPEFGTLPPEFFKLPPATTSFEATSVGRWGGEAGGGLLPVIAAAIAGLFRALFGCRKDEGNK